MRIHKNKYCNKFKCTRKIFTIIFFYKWRSFVFYFFFFYIYIFIFCFYFFITLISVRNVISTKNLDTYIFFIFMNIYVGTYISVTYSNLWERFFVKKIKKKKGKRMKYCVGRSVYSRLTRFFIVSSFNLILKIAFWNRYCIVLRTNTTTEKETSNKRITMRLVTLNRQAIQSSHFI